MNEKHESNRRAWNEAAVAYRKELPASLELLKSGRTSFAAPELEPLKRIVPDLGRCIHLQCAAGTDTLSLINLGAKEVVGVDISEEMIALAREKSSQLGMNAKWYVSDVLQTPSELNGTADLLYTGRGAIIWMMDIHKWAEVVARLLKPGGTFYLFEGHPVTYFFKMDAPDLAFDPQFEGYFAEKIYESNDWPTTYVGKIKDEQATKFERAWPVSTVVNALLGAGLGLQRFEEYPDAYWNEFPNLPKEKRELFPNSYSLVMTKC